MVRYNVVSADWAAVEETVMMWDWLFENPKMHKKDYVEKFILPENWPHTFLCYLCDVWEKDENCEGCPLSSVGLQCQMTEKFNDPYGMWLDAMALGNWAVASEQARIIADVCREWLASHGR